MKNLIVFLIVYLFLVLGAGMLFAQDYGVADTVSIDDMDPILYQDEFVTEEESSQTGLYIGIAVVAIVAGVVIYKVVNRKK